MLCVTVIRVYVEIAMRKKRRQQNKNNVAYEKTGRLLPVFLQVGGQEKGVVLVYMKIRLLFQHLS